MRQRAGLWCAVLCACAARPPAAPAPDDPVEEPTIIPPSRDAREVVHIDAAGRVIYDNRVVGRVVKNQIHDAGGRIVAAWTPSGNLVLPGVRDQRAARFVGDAVVRDGACLGVREGGAIEATACPDQPPIATLTLGTYSGPADGHRVATLVALLLWSEGFPDAAWTTEVPASDAPAMRDERHPRSIFGLDGFREAKGDDCGDGCGITDGFLVYHSAPATPAQQAAFRLTMGCTDDVPAMSSTTSPSGVVASSSHYDAYSEPWHAFDSNGTTMWISSISDPSPWISYEWKTPRVVHHYAIAFANGSLRSRAPRAWALQGWRGAWVTLDTRTNQGNWSGLEVRAFDVARRGRFAKYRLLVTEDNDPRPGIAVVSLSDFALCEKR